ncbi:uncharacterized protein LOC111361744 [Spodoptera litura]|uniref:Uncharacterized protein LOC111361744 n=1 Tax=Spodoptera litura TaxID=69820 RepID=A0A9J7ESG4_SPOLT|nr:uncharacterized protein LOC111361744 [Spodoptera litura]
MDRCINCGIATSRCNTLGYRALDDEMILAVVAIEVTSRICHACWVAADRAAVHMVSRPSTSSQASRMEEIPVQFLAVDETQPREQVLAADSSTEEVHPPPVQVRAVELPVEVIQPPAQVIAADPPMEEVRRNQQEPTIVLPDYIRAIETERRCFIEGCQRTERYRVPLSTRKMLLSRYKYYVPENNRLCDRHLVIEAWDFLTSLRNNYVQTFTAKHIQDMLSLKEVVQSGLLHFKSIDDMEDHVIHTWIGLNKTQFHQMFNEVPQLLEIPRASLALAAYLIKLRTGDSNERLSTLLAVSRRTLEKWLHQVRDLLYEYFVPRHLSLHHINKQQIVQRNLSIPKTLFGNFEGVDRPIVHLI